MGHITFPSVFSAGDVVSAPLITENIHAPNLPADSLDVINGQLSLPNWPTGVLVKREKIQRGAFTNARSNGSTSNRDYFRDWFVVPQTDDIDQDAVEAAYLNQYISIVNAGRPFHVRSANPVAVYLSWALYMSNDGQLDNSGPSQTEQCAYIKLFVDGDSTDFSHTRRSSRPCEDTNTYAGESYRRTYKHTMANYITGHAFIDGSGLARGMHNAQLRLLSNCNQVRVNACIFNVLVIH